MPILEYAERQKSHCNCIVCGNSNPISLGLKFSILPDGGVFSMFKGSALFQGYHGILHGGIIAALLDATMTHCLFHNKIQAVTGDLQIRFLKPVPCSSSLELRARIDSSFSPLYKLSSELTCEKQLMARGKAKFMETSDPVTGTIW
jgi:acyl-coenzyme A thioesterase PaaI-like protein